MVLLGGVASAFAAILIVASIAHTRALKGAQSFKIKSAQLAGSGDALAQLFAAWTDDGRTRARNAIAVDEFVIVGFTGLLVSINALVTVNVGGSSAPRMLIVVLCGFAAAATVAAGRADVRENRYLVTALDLYDSALSNEDGHQAAELLDSSARGATNCALVKYRLLTGVIVWSLFAVGVALAT